MVVVGIAPLFRVAVLLQRHMKHRLQQDITGTTTAFANAHVVHPPPPPCAGMEAEVQTLGMQVATIKTEYDSVAATLTDRTARLHACDGEIVARTKDKSRLLKQRDQLDADVRSKEGRLKALERDMRAAEESLRQIEEV